jgi:molybdenum cofactor cytidylyltransferase
MGAFKPLLPFGNKTVIQSCLDYLHEAGIKDIVTVLGHRADDLRAQIKNVIVAINPDPTSEMGASIEIGVHALPETTKAVVIALVDHPAVPPNTVSDLIHEWKNGARIVIPTWQNRGGHPLLVDLSFKHDLLNLDRTGGLRTLLKTHQEDVKRMPVDSPFVARDMDTWDDYKALYEEVMGHPPPNESQEGLI